MAGALVDGNGRPAIWAVALVFDMAGPVFIDPGGWRLVPGPFAERHWLIIIVALGESIVAIGVGAAGDVDGGVILASVLGMAVACALWWAYFDVSAPAAARRLAEAEEGSVRNRLARDGFSYLHLPMVAAIVLVALGMKSTLAHVGDRLEPETAAALVGGAALYLLAHVAFKLRALGTRSVDRMVAALVLLALAPLARRVDAVVAVAIVGGLLWATFAVEALRHAEARRAIREAEHLRHAGD